MKSKIYLYADFLHEDFLIRLFDDYDVVKIKNENLDKRKITNKNILIITKDNVFKKISQHFFKNNNVFIFCYNKEKYLKINKDNKSMVFFAPTNIKKFHNVVKNYFKFNTFIFKEIKIVGETLSNTKNGLSCYLTNLEKKILIEFIEQRQINRDYFLENVLGINKHIETKTIESHLTRIRKKLSKIKSQINISSKEDIFFLQS